jgi:hypothetical protein
MPFAVPTALRFPCAIAIDAIELVVALKLASSGDCGTSARLSTAYSTGRRDCDDAYTDAPGSSADEKMRTYERFTL